MLKVHTLFKFLVHLGINEDEPGTTGGSPSLLVYRCSFETAFLQTTEEYYSKESTQLLSENPVTEYMKKVCKYALINSSCEIESWYGMNSMINPFYITLRLKQD